MTVGFTLSGYLAGTLCKEMGNGALVLLNLDNLACLWSGLTCQLLDQPIGRQGLAQMTICGDANLRSGGGVGPCAHTFCNWSLPQAMNTFIGFLPNAPDWLKRCELIVTTYGRQSITFFLKSSACA